MTAMPSGTAPPNWSGLPSSRSLAVPDAMTCWASRMTAGSAQAPPIHPRSSPSAVMIAREPCWLEDGPCRQTTVASANPSPRRDSSAASSMTSQPFITGPPLLIRAHGRRTGHIPPVGDGLPDPVR
jgi:hypothetical protein